MNTVDWIIIGVIGFLAFRGFRRGFVLQFLDVLGAILALVAAFRWFEPAGGVIANVLRISATLGNVLGFVLIGVAVSGCVSFCGLMWRRATKTSPLSLADSLGGSVFGVIKAVLIIGFIFTIIGAFPVTGLHSHIAQSGLARDIGHATPIFYSLLERSLPASVPRLLITPEGPQLRRAKLSELSGAHCVDCSGKAVFKGFQSKGLLYSPRFICSQCGRTSDGCQTYEGHHQIYNRCPVELANDGIAIDCLSWPNNRPVRVKGPCPVCGRTLQKTD